MKKIGIITYHYNANYGTMLQAFALQKKCLELGVSAEIINFRPASEKRTSRLSIILRRVPIYIKELGYFLRKHFMLKKFDKKIKERNNKFNDFYEKNVLHSIKYTAIDELKATNSKYDIVLVGSDQTWNLNVGQNMKPVNFLEFIENKKIVKASYAPSIGLGKIDDNMINYYKKVLPNFQYLSCREKKYAEKLTNLLNKHVEFVLDPTLLISAKEWEKYEENCGECFKKKKYLVQYFLGENKENRLKVKKIAEKLNLEVVVISGNWVDFDDKTMFVGPSEFIYLLRNAEFVCTDSFHGTLFSINFNKQFYSFPKRKASEKNSDNNRLYDFLEILALQDRIIENGVIKAKDKIDYTKINYIINKLKITSEEYLKKSIS